MALTEVDAARLNDNVFNATGPYTNRIINGDMRIDQRNAGAEINPAVNATYYLDRWFAASGASSKFKIGQNAGSVTPPSDFNKYLGCTSLSAYTAGSSEAFGVRQIIEGFNVADLAFGTASAKTITISFYVRSSLTGTFGGAVRNGDATRSYPFTYSISSANTWEQKSITVPGDTSGTWATDNGAGMLLNFSLGAGATVSGTAGAWAGANYSSATGATSVVATNGATFYITGVQLEAGSVATPFERRSYGQELALCQRYFTVIASGSSSSMGAGAQYNASNAYGNYSLPVTMRVNPTISATTGTGYYAFIRNDAGDECDSVTLGSATTNRSVEFYNNTQISGTPGHGGFWRTNNAASFFAVQAEL